MLKANMINGDSEKESVCENVKLFKHVLIVNEGL